jgi:hypothetical protein
MSPIRMITGVVCCLFLAACWGGANIGGSLSGLPSGTSVTLQNNGADNLTLSANGSFWFANPVVAGNTYSATVLTQPTGATCTVTNGSGSVGADENDVNNVAVTCVATASISGTVSGLASGTVTLNNGSAVLVVAGNGAFAFPGLAPAGTGYNVTVGVQPTNGQVCSVSNGSGTVVAATATAISVSCV